MRSMGEVRAANDGDGARVENSPSPSLSPKGERRMKEGDDASWEPQRFLPRKASMRSHAALADFTS
jgi:hypothetical protein